MFNAHNNVTANGTVISSGLWVVTNELRVGQILADQNDTEFGCCQPTDLVGDVDPNVAAAFMSDEQKEHLTGRNGRPSTRGQMYVADMQAWFTNHSFKCEFDSTGRCNHNHWFRTTVGTFDGERMATVEASIKNRMVNTAEAAAAGWHPQV